MDTYLSELAQRFEMSLEECHRAYNLCALQRHMQALGAYGFLSKIRGREWFLDHAAAALIFLKKDLSCFDGEFPALRQLVNELEVCR